MQASTTSAVDAIRRITERMQEIERYASAVAAAVEQQNAVTGEISHNVASAAQGTNDVVAVLDQVASAAGAKRARSAETVLHHPAPSKPPVVRPARRGRAVPEESGGIGGYAWLAASLPSAACAAASRAIGARNGEHDT